MGGIWIKYLYCALLAMTKSHTTLDVILDIFIALTSTHEKQFQSPGLQSVGCMCCFGPQVGQSIMWQRLLRSWWSGSREGEITKGSESLGLKEMPNVFIFPTRPQFPQAFSNVSSSFESSKGLNFWLCHCPHGLIISENVLADRARGLRHSSPRLLSIQSKFSERDMRMLALLICLKGCYFLLPIALSGDKTSHWPETRHEAGPAGYAPRDLLCLFSPGMTKEAFFSYVGSKDQPQVYVLAK